MDWMVNYIHLAWKLACMLKTYRICNPIVDFLKYEFNNKLLGSITLLRVTPDVTWTQPINNIVNNIRLTQNLTCVLRT